MYMHLSLPVSLALWLPDSSNSIKFEFNKTANAMVFNLHTVIQVLLTNIYTAKIKYV